MKRTLFVAILFALLLASCQGSPLIRVGPTPTPFPENFEGKANLGDYSLSIKCEGSGEPTIILERGAWEDRGWEMFDMYRFMKITRTCYYLRAGKPDVNFTKPRTVMDQVKDLHELLKQTGVPGPYILVSAYGADHNLILYTHQYPKDVVGLVAVEPVYPTLYDHSIAVLEALPPDASGARDSYLAYFKDYKANKSHSWNIHPEYLDQRAGEVEVLKVTSLGDVPLTILGCEHGWEMTSDPKVNQVAWDGGVREGVKDFCKLSNRCRYEIVPNTDQVTIFGNKAVDEAIQEMYDQVKKK